MQVSDRWGRMEKCAVDATKLQQLNFNKKDFKIKICKKLESLHCSGFVLIT